MERFLERVYVIVVALLSAAVVVFAVQNIESVAVQLIAWELSAPLVLLILVPFLAGVLIGYLSSWGRERRKRQAQRKAQKAAEAAEALIESSAAGGGLGEPGHAESETEASN